MGTETEKRIFDTAQACLRQGEFSLRAVARKADVSAMLIRHYFGSKEQLKRACLLKRLEEFESTILRDAFRGPREEVSRRLILAACREGRRFANESSYLLESLNDTAAMREQLLERLTSAAPAISQVIGVNARSVAEVLPFAVLLIVRHSLTSSEELATIFACDSEAAIEQSAETVAEMIFGALHPPTKLVSRFTSEDQ